MMINTETHNGQDAENKEFLLTFHLVDSLFLLIISISAPLFSLRILFLRLIPSLHPRVLGCHGHAHLSTISLFVFENDTPQPCSSSPSFTLLLCRLCLIHWTFCFQLSNFFFLQNLNFFIWVLFHFSGLSHPHWWFFSSISATFSSMSPVFLYMSCTCSSFILVCKRCPFWGHSSFLLVGFCGIFLSSFPVAMWEWFGKSNVKEKAYFSSHLKTPTIEGESRQWALGAACRIAPMIRK